MQTEKTRSPRSHFIFHPANRKCVGEYNTPNNKRVAETDQDISRRNSGLFQILLTSRYQSRLCYFDFSAITKFRG